MSGKKFTFPLDSVLRLRRHETEEARQALATVAQSRAELEERLEEARLRLLDIASSVPGGSTGAMKMRQFDAFRRDAQRALTETERALAAKRKAEDDARGHLIVRRGEEEVLNKLREQQQAAHVSEQQHAEGAFLDEQAVAGFFRKPGRENANSFHPLS